MIAVSVLSVLVCCGLAWWQWERFMSAGGTFQNLGYVLQWPLFGLFPAFMFWRMHKLRQQELAEARVPPAAPVVREPRPAPIAEPTTGEADDELAAYNRYLAELNARDTGTTRGLS